MVSSYYATFERGKRPLNGLVGDWLPVQDLTGMVSANVFFLGD